MKKVNRSTYKPAKPRKIKGLSQTVPNEALSIAQLLARHLSGEPLSGKRGVFIDEPHLEDVDGEKFRQLDLAEKEDILEGIRAMTARMKALEKEFQDQQREKEGTKGDPGEGPKSA